MKYSICCLRNVIVKIERDLSSIIYKTLISRVKFRWTTLYRLVLPAGSRTAYVYSEDSIMCAPVVVSGDGGGGVAPVDVIDLNPSTGGGGGGNEILGAGSDCNAAARPIFFTALYGLVNVAPVGGVESANQVGRKGSPLFGSIV